MKKRDLCIKKTLTLTTQMLDLADKGESVREDVNCGVLYSVIRDSAYKLRKLAEDEKKAHIEKGWWKEEEEM